MPGSSAPAARPTPRLGGSRLGGTEARSSSLDDGVQRAAQRGQQRVDRLDVPSLGRAERVPNSSRREVAQRLEVPAHVECLARRRRTDVSEGRRPALGPGAGRRWVRTGPVRGGGLPQRPRRSPARGRAGGAPGSRRGERRPPVPAGAGGSGGRSVAPPGPRGCALCGRAGPGRSSWPRCAAPRSPSIGRPAAAWSARLCAVRCSITGTAVTSWRAAGLRRRRRAMRVAAADPAPARCWTISRAARGIELRRERDQRADERLGLGLALGLRGLRGQVRHQLGVAVDPPDRVDEALGLLLQLVLELGRAARPRSRSRTRPRARPPASPPTPARTRPRTPLALPPPVRARPRSRPRTRTRPRPPARPGSPGSGG